MTSSELDARGTCRPSKTWTRRNESEVQADIDDDQRPRVSRVSSLFPVAEALLAAAHSDRPPSNLEHDAIRRVLCELPAAPTTCRCGSSSASRPSIPPGSTSSSLAEELAERPVVGRKSLIELTREVCDADGELDLSEDRFMLALALALSLDPSEVESHRLRHALSRAEARREALRGPLPRHACSCSSARCRCC